MSNNTSNKSHWATDSSTDYCTDCKRRFDLMNRKHHCRLCGQIFCETCTNWRISVPELEIHQEKACRNCHKYLYEYLPLLNNDGFFVKYHPDGEGYDVRLRVTRDGEKIVWKSEEHNFAIEESVLLEHYQKTVLGQQTEIFQACKPHSLLACCSDGGITKFESRCFSLLFRNETVDLQALSIDSMNQWLEAFREMAARRTTPSAAAIKTGRIQKQEIASQERKSQVSEKYQSLTNKYKSKYGTTE